MAKHVKDVNTLRTLKQNGFSDSYIARNWNMSEMEVYNLRKENNIMPVYKMVVEENFDSNGINVYNINPVDEVVKNTNIKEDKIKLFKLNIKKKTDGIPFTNIIFYDNQNKTLPIGMDLSSKILLNIKPDDFKNEKNYKFNIIDFENEEDEFTKSLIKTIEVFEFDIV